MICRHCKKERAFKGRGLGHRCYSDPAIRALYGPLTADGRRGVPDTHEGAAVAPPAVALTSPPGSPKRIEEYARRAAAAQAIHHPADNNDVFGRRTVNLN